MKETCQGPKKIEDCLNCNLSECKSNKQSLYDFEKKQKNYIPKTSYTIDVKLEIILAGKSSWNF